MNFAPMMVAMMAAVTTVLCHPAAAQTRRGRSRGSHRTADQNATLMAFHSAGCGPCQSMTPVLKDLAGRGVPIRMVDAMSERSLVSRFAVDQTPTYVVMVGGKEVSRLVGIQTARTMVTALLSDGIGDIQQTATQVPSRQTARDAAAFEPRTRLARRDAPQTWGRPQPQPSAEAMPSLAVADAVEKARAATVRLRVHDGRGYGAGTGTIIDVHGNEALVLTCGHLFRETGDQGRIEVDVFVGGQVKTVPGTLIDFDADHRDVAVVAIQPGCKVDPVQVSVAGAAEVGTPAFSFGCDRGKDPSRRDTRVTGVDKYNQHLGASNYEIEGAPIDGRSGGGLFNRAGQLIGVCNAADYDNDTGIYAGAGDIRWQLDRIDMSGLYQNVAAMPQETTGQGSLEPLLAPEPPAAAGTHRELIVIVRDPAGGPDRVVTIRRPTAELMAAVEAGGRRR